jgi:hypothetical protein
MQTHFEGSISPQDVKRHIVHAFDLHEGTTALNISLWHAEGLDDGLSNMLTLSLFDPHGSRGAGHRMGEPADGGRLHNLVISAAHATPGYRAGPLQPDQWSVVIDAHRVTAAEPCTYRLTITTSSDEAANQRPETDPLAPPPPDGGRGIAWYRGDLHGHTLHSDGRFTPQELVAWARSHRLDFVTLTDHNTVSGLTEMDALSSPDVLTMSGMELTTFYGHALALGLRECVDWRVNAPGAPRTIHAIAAEVESKGGLFVIAHPMAVGDPICTGCSWTYDDMMPGAAQLVEVWNSGDWDNDSFNERALALAYGWLNQGHRLVLTSGTDVHGPFAPNTALGFDVVYAADRTEAAILDAVRRGHLFLSSGLHVELNASHETGEQAMMGDAIAAGAITLRITWRDCGEDHQVRLISNGDVIAAWPAIGTGSATQQHDAKRGQWFAVEVRAAHGHIAALTNPIFVN